MIEVEQTTDKDLMLAAFQHPDVFKDVRDDSHSDNPADFPDAVDKMLSIPSVCLKVVVDGVFGGIWWLVWKDRALEAHTMLLPNCRGRKAIEATKKAIRWVWSHTDAAEITSFAWSDSPAVSWFCRMVGLRPTSTEPWQATRYGRPVTITWFSIKREDAPCLSFQH